LFFSTGFPSIVHSASRFADRPGKCTQCRLASSTATRSDKRNENNAARHGGGVAEREENREENWGHRHSPESDTAKGEEDGEPRPPSLASLLISRHLINPRVRSFLPLFFSLESRPRGFCSGEEEAKLSRVLDSRHV
jgi:hypothetical protein